MNKPKWWHYWDLEIKFTFLYMCSEQVCEWCNWFGLL